jgi:hypothetical protein
MFTGSLGCALWVKSQILATIACLRIFSRNLPAKVHPKKNPEVEKLDGTE